MYHPIRGSKRLSVGGNKDKWPIANSIECRAIAHGQI